MRSYFTKLSTCFVLSAVLMTSPQVQAQNDPDCLYGAGKWSVALSGAFSPAVFNEELKITTSLADVRTGPVQIRSNQTDVNQNNLIQRTRSFDFSDHYEHPFQASFNLGYFFRNFTEVFIGADYYVMRGKKFDLFDQTLNGNRIAIECKVKANNRLGMYAGARHYFDMCSWYYPYLGFKVGMVIHTNRDKDKREDLNCTILNGATIDGRSAYQLTGARGLEGLYGGLHAGVDIPLGCLSPYLSSSSFFLGVEAVGHGAIEYDLPIRRVNNSNGGFQLTHEISQAPRTLLSFPLSAGLRVRF